jgi:hypothetical protein
VGVVWSTTEKLRAFVMRRQGFVCVRQMRSSCAPRGLRPVIIGKILRHVHFVDE